MSHYHAGVLPLPARAEPVPGGGVVAIVPLKALDRAKGRLAGDLDPAQRRALTRWMFGRVLAACREADRIDGLLVVAGDQAGAALARRHEASVLVEPRPGLREALAAADRACAGAAATVVVAADLPLARGADLDLVCETGEAPGGPRVVVAPTGDGGTGALYRRPPSAIGTRYGRASAAAHLRLAEHAGLAAVTLHVPALALDVDTAGQLRQAALLDGGMGRWASALH